jgi:hypothetical protein
MAGLLDIFGTSGVDTLGLLGMSPEDVQHSRDDAQAQALYGLAGRLFKGGNLGASIAEGLQAGQGLYKTAMKDQMQERFLTTQLKEAQAKKAEQKRVEDVISSGIMPATAAVQTAPGQFYGQATDFPLRDDEGNLMPGATLPIEGKAAKPAHLDLMGLQAQLMKSEYGRDAFAKLVAAQKTLLGDTTVIPEGGSLVSRDIFGNTGTIATGAAKVDKPSGAVHEAMQVLGINKPIAALTVKEREEIKSYIDRKDAQKQPKFSVNLKDSTAVAQAQMSLIKDWGSVVKETNARETADRFKSVVSAVDLGNAGNKTADGSLIFAIGKLYDPSGAVQEGDKNTILGNRSIPDSIQAYANKIFDGGVFLPSERAGLLSVARSIVKSKAAHLDAAKEPYTKLSTELGGKGDLLLNPLSFALDKNFGKDDVANDALIMTPALSSALEKELAKRSLKVGR